jgi:multidrug efflux system membrane fusion protein
MIRHKDVEAPPTELPSDIELAPDLAPPPPHERVLPPGDEVKILPAGEEVKALPPPAAPPNDKPRQRPRGGQWLWLLLSAILGFAAFRYFETRQEKKQAEEKQQASKQAHRAVTVAAAPAHLGNLPIYLRGLGTVTAYNTVNVKTRVDGPIVAVNFTEGQNVEKGDLLVEIDPRTFQATLNQAQGQLARDEAQLHDAEVNLARYDTLWKEGVIAKQQRDTQAAQAGQFQGTIEADQAAINSARLQLGFTRVTAPIN